MDFRTLAVKEIPQGVWWSRVEDLRPVVARNQPGMSTPLLEAGYNQTVPGQLVNLQYRSDRSNLDRWLIPQNDQCGMHPGWKGKQPNL